jgi:hypothetical protein
VNSSFHQRSRRYFRVPEVSASMAGEGIDH